MKRRSKRRLAPTTRVDGVAGKRKRFRGGYSLAKLLAGGKTFTRHNSSKNSGKIELTTRRLFFSLSLELQKRSMRSRQERADAVRWLVSLESTVRARGDLHKGTRPQAHKAQDSSNYNKHNTKIEGGDFTLAGLHSRPRT